jgi:O-methyltransferase involved in polyketide biosynthesis
MTPMPGGDRIAADLSGVSETMLWSLHNRASESKRHDGVLCDPDSVRIHESIDYDFTGQFGDPCGSLAARAAAIDDVLRHWLERHPDGCIVSLGEGLETQARRVDNGRMRWCSVDLPAAISLRDRFLPPTDRFCHLPVSVLDPAWMDAVDASSGVCIVAQGLLMYLEPELVSGLFGSIGRRFPGADLVFDTVPRWFSELTLAGLSQTPRYRLPAMPWGINRDEIEPALRAVHPGVATVDFLAYRSPRGAPWLMAELAQHIPVARHGVPSLVHVTTAPPGGEDGRAMQPVPYDLLTTSDPTIRSLSMPSSSDDASGVAASVGGMGGLSAMAIQTMNCGDDIVRASQHVIAKRVALGIEAALVPSRADHAEFARIIPEKVEAFAAAGQVMMRKSGEANRQMFEHVWQEGMTAANAAVSMSRCLNPAELAVAQGQFAHAWLGRAAARCIAMGMFAMGAQAAALAPIRQTVVGNSARLVD